jgi:hypothetical protein
MKVMSSFWGWVPIKRLFAWTRLSRMAGGSARSVLKRGLQPLLAEGLASRVLAAVAGARP